MPSAEHIRQYRVLRVIRVGNTHAAYQSIDSVTLGGPHIRAIAIQSLPSDYESQEGLLISLSRSLRAGEDYRDGRIHTARTVDSLDQVTKMYEERIQIEYSRV